MIKPTLANVKHILLMLDYTGHVELPDSDLFWLAEQLAARLSASSLETCDACGRPSVLVATTRLGMMCSDCLEEAADAVDNIRETLTESGETDDQPRTILAKGGSLTRF